MTSVSADHFLAWKETKLILGVDPKVSSIILYLDIMVKEIRIQKFDNCILDSHSSHADDGP